jgi:predicted dehydrogenase/threonine dehydrogenase-like Zn-dependent dehydrogenase
MKQIIQNPKTGKLEMVEVPVPAVAPGQVLVRTEKMVIEFARKSILGKARSRPDLVGQVLRKVKQEGPLPTYRAVMNRLDAPQPLGYSCAGVVEAVGEGVTGFAPGDRIACAGAGYANHAEWVSVPENLCALVPEGVGLEKAAFATVGAIALQGIRVAAPSLGEIAVVIGLGLIGQLASQLLRANGCRVLGIDLDAVRVKQALDQGAEWGACSSDDLGSWRASATGGCGADFALVTAASDSSEPIQLAAELCRMKGRVAVVGATAMNLDRRAFYEKELELRMSTSYGPGRYDRSYEEAGLDYPISYVRWTENRNLQAFLSLVASGAIDPAQLDTQTTGFAEAERCYEALASGDRRGLAIVFRYDEVGRPSRSLELRPRPGKAKDQVGVGFIGAGNYAKAVLLPEINRGTNIRKMHIVTATGASARHTAEKFRYASCGTDPQLVFNDPDVDLVFIATQHDSHASLAARALRAGKAVWLEKPAAIDEQQLQLLVDAVMETSGFLSVGFNRRFPPLTRAVKETFADRVGPMAIHYAVSAGPTPSGTWLTDPRAGGGRIIGEACHFVDLCTYLVGLPPQSVFARALGREPETDDSTIAILGFPDGSTASIAYLANTSSDLPKERWEASADAKTAMCDNFRITRLPGGKRFRSFNQDKGHKAAIDAVTDSVRMGRPSPLSLMEILAFTRATFGIIESAASNHTVRIARPTSD